MAATRKSTQKFEIVQGSFVVLTGKSRTECENIARAMNKGQKNPMFRVTVRPVKL